MARRRLLHPIFPAILLAACATPLPAQVLTRPHLDWRTLRTEHFDIHHPEPLTEWTRGIAGRIEAIHEDVARVVGSAPAARVTVIVDDPFNIANGFALPLLDAPLIYLFPTPPGPSLGIGHHRDWGELLLVHELAHLAHLTRPSRNPRQRMLWGLLPLRFGPLARRAPRWVTEGYATYVEGRLTGGGRPHGIARAALLRQRALEGRLPTYAQLDGSRGFQDGAMAYLAGSAFLEWLIAKRGEESLVHLWRRLTARRVRGFAEAFAGVYGGMPEQLYGRFTAELTGRALAIEATLREAGLETGDTVQRREWWTGQPTISRDGELMAIVLGFRDRPSRVVVWKTADEPEDERAVRARERALRRDPEDVPAIEWRPRPKRPVATLHPPDGRPFMEPRFLPDGEQILLTRMEPLADGTVRPDLFVWQFRSGGLRRITRGAALRQPAPAPDGARAVAVQCLHGSCSLVQVALGTGELLVLAAGSPTRSYHRPRFSPDGRRIVVSVQEHGLWQLAVGDADGDRFDILPSGGGASRYDAAFLTGGDALVAVSERGGIANLERIALATGVTRPLTRVTSAVEAPEPHPTDGSIYFLHLHARGMDLNRVHPDSISLGDIVVLDSARAPVVPIAPPPAEAFHTHPVPDTRPYQFGPRQSRFLPGGGVGAEGHFFSGMLLGSDPVGRLSWLLQGAYGHPGSWRGLALAAEWRRFRSLLSAEVFHVGQRPSEQRIAGIAPAALDATYTGATASVARTIFHGPGALHLRGGVSHGRLDGPALDPGIRQLAFVDGAADRVLLVRERWRASMDVTAHGALGRTGAEDEPWWRAAGSAGATLERGGRGVSASVLLARVAPSAPPFEQLAVGGVPVPLVEPAILSQRLAMPALPIGTLAGADVLAIRGSLTGGLLQPYYWIGRAADEGRWHRVLGSEARLRLPPIPLVRLPAISAVAGIGHSLDEPFRRKTRGYLSVTYRP